MQPLRPPQHTTVSTLTDELPKISTQHENDGALAAPFNLLDLPNFRQTPRQNKFGRRWLTALLVSYDAVLISCAFLLVYRVSFNLGVAPTFFADLGRDFAQVGIFEVLYTLCIILGFWGRGLYRSRPIGAPLHRIALIVTTTTGAFALFAIAHFLWDDNSLGIGLEHHEVIVLAWLMTMGFLLAGRTLLATVLSFVYRSGAGRMPVLVIGSGHLGKLIMQHLTAATALGYHITGFIQEDEGLLVNFGRFKALGTMTNLPEILERYSVREVIITSSSLVQTTAAICEPLGIRMRIVPDLREVNLTRIRLTTLEGIPVFSMDYPAIVPWQRIIKRLMDITGAACLLFVGIPIWGALAVLIKLDSPGPVIYSQKRVGRDGKEFVSHKFRSMHVGADAQKVDLTAENQAGRGLFKLKNDPRCTRVGRWIRRTSLDEIPQLWNVLRGEMSLVGPRPPLPEEAARYEPWEMRRLELTPGLTGLWQVRGRSNITFDEMVVMDLYYVENWSLRLDLEILFKTFSAVLFSRGAY